MEERDFVQIYRDICQQQEDFKAKKSHNSIVN
jgi:hypothetical protein